MDRYKQNARWLKRLALFRQLPLSAAYLTPFFLEKGLSLSEIFLLQSVFSLAVVLLEVPSGYFADRYGRAFSIKLSAPLAATAMIAYGFSDQFWQFAACELLLAVANSMLSGVDTALLVDSLKADGHGEAEYTRQARRIDCLGYLATGLAVPVSFGLVHFYGVSAAIIADGLLVAIGARYAWRLVEAPQLSQPQEAQSISAWQAICSLARSREARWLVVLGSTLSTATYLGFWISAPYYQTLGIPVVYFGAILAVRSFWKAWLSHRFQQEKHLERSMFGYALTAGMVYLAMATQQVWLVWAVLGHDIVQALHRQPITARLNSLVDSRHRATVNSAVGLVQRLLFAVAGPVVGLMVDKAGLGVGFTVTGVVCSLVALAALMRLHQLGTFEERR